MIINNNVNPVIYDVIESLKKNYNSEVKIKKRRIPFSKECVHNPNGALVNDLIYENTVEDNFSHSILHGSR